MKLNQLFESLSHTGYYSSFPFSEGNDGNSEEVENELLKAGCRDVKVYCYTDLGVRCKLISQNYESLQNALKIATYYVKMMDKIYYSSGEEPVHDFTGFPKIIKSDLVFEDNCTFTSLKGIDKHFTEVHGKIYFDANKIKSNVLGVVKIKGVTEISTSADYRKIHGWKLEEILNKYLRTGDIFDCQDELIDAGLEEYAKL